MNRAFFTFAAFVTGSMMEACPGYLVHLVYSASKRCPSSAAISSSSNSNSLSSVYITPPVAAVSCVTGRHRHLVAGLVPGTAGLVSCLVAVSTRQTMSPSAASLVVPTISSTFSSKSAIAQFRNARQTKMADVDCIRIFVCIHYPTDRRRLVRQQPSAPSCRRSRPRDRRSRPRSRLRRTLSPPAASLVVPTISSTFSSKSTIAKFRNTRQTKMADVDSNIQHRHVTLKNYCT